MAISSIRTGETGISLALDNNYMEPIATTLVGSGGATIITFNDIPQNYKHLQIRGIAQFTLTSDPGGSGGASLWFNNDFSSNYTRHEIDGDGASAITYAIAPVSAALMQRFPFRQTNDNIYGAAICDILDYSNKNKYKTIRNIGGFEKNSTSSPTGDVYLNSALWINSDPIFSISIGNSTWNMKQHTRFSLYGIKG